MRRDGQVLGFVPSAALNLRAVNEVVKRRLDDFFKLLAIIK